ncbi:hypothetical protein [Devosia sp.]|uniref:hypothetical protein n=1 Tax=Devosia sp. TaxID=1871048 RepID=UPI002EF02663
MQGTRIAGLDTSGPSAISWGSVSRQDARPAPVTLLIATLPAAGIIGLAAAWLLAVL